MPGTLIEGGPDTRKRVLVVGGGIAALEAAIALRQTAHEFVDVTLLAPRQELTYRALSVAEPFGLVEPYRLDLAEAASDQGAHFRCGALKSFDPRRRIAVLVDGQEISYDYLLLAIGTTPSEALTGAFTFRGPVDVPAFRDILGDLEAGRIRRLAFAVASGQRWTLPLYELALMTAAYAAGRGIDAEIEFVTAEKRPLEIFGKQVSDHVSALMADAGIVLSTGLLPLAVNRDRIILAPSGSITADRVVALPNQRVPRIGGLPRESGGFVQVDPFGKVHGIDRVYAAGDLTWHPIKQGGLAAQQADAAASAIAAAAGAPVVPTPFEPVLRGVLLTGGAPEYLHGANGVPGEANENALWWPPAKVAARYLAPYLAGTTPGVPLHDEHTDHHPALELALEAADAAAGWDDLEGALRWLDAAERINLVLPSEYAEKRERWRGRATA